MVEHVRRDRGEKLRLQIAAVVLASIMFLYDFIIGSKGAQVPIYIPMIALALGFLGFKARDVYLLVSAIVFFVTISILQRLILPADVDPVRTTSGVVLLIVVLFSVSKIFEISATNRHQYTFPLLKALFWGHIGVQVLQGIYIKMTGNVIQNTVFPFLPRAAGIAGEASHVAMILSPLIFMSVLAPRQFRHNFGPFSNIVLALSVLLIGYSATGYVAYFGALICRLFYKRAVFLVLTGVPLLFAGGFFFLPVRDRLIGVVTGLMSDADLTVNTSSLVLLKGIEMALGALQHHPLGAGMLNFAALEKYSRIAGLSEKLGELNNHDGSSLLLKGIGEFGYLFVAFYGYTLWRFSRDLWGRVSVDQDVLKYAFLFAFLISAVRGASYFDGPQLVGLVIALHVVLRYHTFRLRQYGGALPTGG